MKSWNKAGKAWLVIAATLLVTAGASSSWGAALNTKGEGKCHGALTKGIGKHVAAITKAMATCTNDVLAGDIPGPCPDTEAQAAITKSAEKIAKSVNKKCQSSCSSSSVPCIGSNTCPPNGALNENCTAGGKNFFEFNNMSFPGPYCETLLGADMIDPEDFGACAAGVAGLITDELMENVYGGLTGTPPLSEAAESCLAAIAKSAPKTASKLAATVGKCRISQLTASVSTLLPDTCATSDAKTSAKITKTLGKFTDGIAKKCTDSAIEELDICRAGVGGTLTVGAAQTCLAAVVEEAGSSVEDAETRLYSGISIINGAYPDTAAARCGDNVVNQGIDQFFPLGEECDGEDDSECPGECLPSGDTFQCTCGNIRRARAFANGNAADLDNGWSGSSHNAKVTEGAGFVAEVSNCDCDEFDPLNPATCIGTSSDPVCDSFAELKPRCSHRIGDGTTCDQAGNNNGANDRTDCQACDAFAGNAGDFCTGVARYCIGGANTGERCNQAADCPGGTCNGIGACLDGPFAGNGCAGPENCGVCLGGINVGLTCSTNGNCPGSSCEGHTCATDSCIGGVNAGNPCTSDTHCPGSRCAKTSDCTAQCYGEDDIPTTTCARQADCADGERCRGACDKTNTCIITRNGAPLPLSSEGTSVCVDSQFHTNAVGTRNLVTGENAVSYELRSVVHLADTLNSVPCPVCGGWCAVSTPAAATDRTRCEGQCSDPDLACRYGPNIGETCLTNTDCEDFLCAPLRCRFDSDCPAGTCSGEDSPECQGRDCRLDLACNSGLRQDLPCRIEASTAFGTTSPDCRMTQGSNVSGTGLALVWNPLGSGPVTLQSPAPCDAGGYQNYDCNCLSNPIGRPGSDSTRNQPNRCQPACTDPDPEYFGIKCNNFTVCVGGAEAGIACDEDTDCSGGVCTGNPRVCGDGNVGECSARKCTGGVNAGEVCSQGAECPGSSCDTVPCTVGGTPCDDGYCVADPCLTDPDCVDGGTCDDACPAGLCVPLCVERGICNGGDRDRKFCALDVDCVGGGSCIEPGECRNGAYADDRRPCVDNTDCDGGGTCEVIDVVDGACAQSAFTHCDGPGWEFVSCAPAQVGTQQGCEMGTDSIRGNANDNVGAGYCRADIRNCFVNDGAAEGGTTLNGRGDPTNAFVVTSYCIPASINGSVNVTAGLPGPGRIRQPVRIEPNFDVLP
ncbi:MAG: hypothetical protein ABR538_16230 [Candidatus Binatia bacterium]